MIFALQTNRTSIQIRAQHVAKMLTSKCAQSRLCIHTSTLLMWKPIDSVFTAESESSQRSSQKSRLLNHTSGYMSALLAKTRVYSAAPVGDFCLHEDVLRWQQPGGHGVIA